MSDKPGGSGLELDFDKKPGLDKRDARQPREEQPVVEVGGRPRMPKQVEEELPTDSTTGGAFIVIALVHIAAGVALAVNAPAGEALVTMVVVLLSAVLTFVFYYVTGFLVHHFGFIALLLFGGWFSLVVGLAAQLVHRMFPWLTWKVLSVVASLAVAFAWGLDHR